MNQDFHSYWLEFHDDDWSWCYISTGGFLCFKSNVRPSFVPYTSKMYNTSCIGRSKCTRNTSSNIFWHAVLQQRLFILWRTYVPIIKDCTTNFDEFMKKDPMYLFSDGCRLFHVIKCELTTQVRKCSKNEWEVPVEKGLYERAYYLTNEETIPLSLLHSHTT